jgi:hypothetical protein
MFSVETTLLALVLIVASGFLVRWHWRVWQSSEGSDAEPSEKDFLHRQCRRRMQASGMIGVIRIGMFIGQFLDRWPLLKLFHWAGVLLLVLWMLLLAVADLIVTRQHFGRLRRDHLMDEIRFQADLRRRNQDGLSSDDQSTGEECA